MRLMIWYFVVAGVASLAFALLLARIAGSERIPYLPAVAVGLALAWPLTLPLVSFGSVAATELIRSALRKKAEAAAASGALVSPAGVKV